MSKRYIVRFRHETNWQALGAYAEGNWNDLPKSPRWALKTAHLDETEFTKAMILEISFKRVRKGKKP